MNLIRAISVGLLFCFWVAPVHAAESTACAVGPLPERDGPRVLTTGSVPHEQVGVTPIKKLNTDLFSFAFSLPGVEKRPTIVSLPGATGMWLTDSVPVSVPKAIVAGREFAHIHTDGSLHAAFSYERAIELEQKGWGERHPWADRNDGWEGLVMLYSAGSATELDVLMQLVTESYNHITGQSLKFPDC